MISKLYELGIKFFYILKGCFTLFEKDIDLKLFLENLDPSIKKELEKERNEVEKISPGFFEFIEGDNKKTEDD